MNHKPSKRPTQISWYGDVPAHWQQMRLKDVVDGCVNGFWGDEALGDGLDTQVIRVADFNRNERRVAEGPTFRSIKPEQRAGRTLAPGDLLIEKSGGGELQPVGMVVQYEGKAGAVCSNFVARMRPRESVVGRYLCFLHAHLYERSVTTLSIKQSTGIQNLDSAAYLGEACFLPPPEEQVAIASYLDVETARIDELIAQKLSLIKLLEEAKASEIERAVHPPSGFGRTELKRVVLRISTGPFGSALHSSDYVDGGTPVINPTHIVNGKIVADPSVSVSDEAVAALSIYRLMPSDLVVGRRGEMGRCAVVSEEDPSSLCGTGCLMINTDQSRALSDYLHLVISSRASKDWLSLESVGSTMENLNSEILGRLPCYIPCIKEQRRRIHLARKEVERYGRLIQHVEHEIEMVVELRSATITEAVLGRIDVRATIHNNKELEAA